MSANPGKNWPLYAGAGGILILSFAFGLGKRLTAGESSPSTLVATTAPSPSVEPEPVVPDPTLGETPSTPTPEPEPEPQTETTETPSEPPEGDGEEETASEPVQESEPEIRDVPSDGTFGYRLQRTDVDGKRFWLPPDWQREEILVESNGNRTHRWTQGDSFIRIDVTPNDADPMIVVRQEEKRFSRSKRYGYERKRIRQGSDAYLGGVIWNFRLKRDEGPWMTRTIAYVRHDGKTYAVSTGCPEEQKGYGRLFTDLLNSFHDWEG